MASDEEASDEEGSSRTEKEWEQIKNWIISTEHDGHRRLLQALDERSDRDDAGGGRNAKVYSGFGAEWEIAETASVAGHWVDPNESQWIAIDRSRTSEFYKK